MTTDEVPAFRQVVLDTTDARGLAEFYRQLLGWPYRPGDEPPPDGEPDPLGQDWLVLRDPGGGVGLAFQHVAEQAESTWPDPNVPQQLHLDMTVSSIERLDRQHERALSLGAQMRLDRSDDNEEPLRVYADPAGHPFCIFVAPDPLLGPIPYRAELSTAVEEEGVTPQTSRGLRPVVRHPSRNSVQQALDEDRIE